MILTGKETWRDGRLRRARSYVPAAPKPPHPRPAIGCGGAPGRDISGERLVVTSNRVFVAGTNGVKQMVLRYAR
jgi:hypothetical protein